MVVRAGQGFHGTVNQSSAFKIEQSLRFNSANSAYLNRTPGSAGNRKTWTWSGWAKRGKLNVLMSFLGVNALNCGDLVTRLQFNSSNQLKFDDFVACGSTHIDLITTQVFRDPSAWIHIVVAVDTTQGTAANRAKLYVNGSQVTAFATETYPTQNQDTAWNSTLEQRIGRDGDPNYLDGYLAEVNFIDGSALDPTDFGFTDPLTNTWRPKKYTGTYGTNGFYLDFSDSSNLGADRSGNGNNFTASGFVADDLVPDSPSGVTFTTAPTSGITTNNSGPSNYCTLNPLYYTASGIVQSDGNLKVTFPSAPPNGQRGGTLATTNAFYAEASPTALSGGSVYAAFGVIPPYRANSTTSEAGSFSDGWSYAHNGQIRNNNSAVTTVATYTVNDLIGVACDPSKGTIEFFKNGTSVYSGTGVPNVPMTVSVAQVGGSGASGTWVINCGQKDFSYTPPSGFLPICTANLPTPTSPAVVRPDKYFNTVLYTGTGVDNHAITGVGFQPDWVWLKTRSVSDNHVLQDVVRGAQKQLFTNSTDYEFSATTLVKSFDSDGFTVGTDSGANGSGRTFVAWCWKAGDATVSNSDGSITSQVSANQDAGFSIVNFTGTGANATVGHGLGVAPDLLILKNRDNGLQDWPVYHSALGATKQLVLSSTAAASTNSVYWNNTEPTSTVFTVGTAGNTNGSGEETIAYCFAEVEGYSKFGSYTGNGSSDGVFVYCGFSPRWILWKETTVGESWFIHDTARTPYNVSTQMLRPNYSNAEATGDSVDILSNGFKFRSGGAGANYSGRIYIFAAFAEAPTNNLFGGQANSR